MTLICHPLHPAMVPFHLAMVLFLLATVPLEKNGPVEPSNGTIEKKTGAVFFLILAVAKPLFSVTNHPSHLFLAPKSTVLQH